MASESLLVGDMDELDSEVLMERLFIVLCSIVHEKELPCQDYATLHMSFAFLKCVFLLFELAKHLLGIEHIGNFYHPKDSGTWENGAEK